MNQSEYPKEPPREAIAIIGMAGRFPKARTLAEYWQNLCQGREAISHFTDAEAARPAERPQAFVNARGWLEDADQFDAAFFGINPKEAEILDPQHRVFLECAWEALEAAGYDAEKYGGAMGVFAGMSANTYLPQNLLSHPELVALVGEYPLLLANDKDFLPTRVSYKLNLKGPSLNIQTACSTSLVAVCVACQQLLARQCDLALAGAVSITLPQKRGYFFQDGGIASPDGHCRPFDAQAAGTVQSDGVGVVALKRLSDALADGDQIQAVIKGFAVNNDGSQKIGYTAPSVDGQAEVIVRALASAGISPETITYVEAHGTATPLGDPIEIAALTQAFRLSGATRNGFCAIGSVKSNLGHLDTAAGMAGLIKTVLALQNHQLPPTLHFTKPNPQIDFLGSPFYVNSSLIEWNSENSPRRAGVSSFGIGGTNAHVVLEEAPPVSPARQSRPAHLLLLSAKTASALDTATRNLQLHLRQNPALTLADVAFTLAVGRRGFCHRRMSVCHDVNEAIEALAQCDSQRIGARLLTTENPPVAFLLPGQGAQQVNMACDLYQHEPVFREQVDTCCAILEPHLGFDLRSAIFPGTNDLASARQLLIQTGVAQPALFVIEYALAQLWMTWGIQPAAMIGHSLGEYVAACLAGVMTLTDALALIAARGKLMQKLPPGAMLVVRLPESEVLPLLDSELSLAAANGSTVCVVSGPPAPIESLENQLTHRAIACARLQTSHAFHSAMMDPVMAPLARLMSNMTLQPPRIPFVSNLTGTWITAEQAVSPGYWAQHLRKTVRFADGLQELLSTATYVLLEVGPGQTLCSLARQHPAKNAAAAIIPSLPRPQKESAELSEFATLLHGLGQLWLAGTHINWPAFYRDETRQRVALPAYPFERKRFWIEPAVPPITAAQCGHSALGEAPDQAAESSVSVPPQPPLTALATETRLECIAAKLQPLLEKMSGLAPAAIGREATFVDMGLDSLFLTQFVLAIEKTFGVRLAFRQLLGEYASLNAVARHLDQVLPSKGEAPLNPTANGGPPATGPVTTTAPSEAAETRNLPCTVPLTESQRELWLACRASVDASCVFNECRLLHLRGPLRREVLQGALQQVVDRHEALRMVISPAGDGQRLLPEVKLAIGWRDASALSAQEFQAQLEAIQTEEAHLPFNLAEGPLLRALLLRGDERHHVLVLTVHHLVCDGRSLDIVLSELGALYSAGCQGRPRQWEPPPAWSEFASRKATQPPATIQADWRYWQAQLAAPLPVLELPTDHPRPASWRFDGARERLRLPAALGRALKRLSAEQGCTLFVTLLSGFTVWLHRLSGQPDVLAGIPIADRAMAGDESLVGHCINFLPLRSRTDNDPSFLQHLARVQLDFLDAFDHQQCAYGSLLQRLKLPRDPSRMPLVSATFNFDRVRAPWNFFDLEVELAPSRWCLANFDLSLNLTEFGDELAVDCRFSTHLFEADTVRRWLGHFRSLLEGIAAKPLQRISQLPMLSPKDRQQVLADWNNTCAPYPYKLCLHQLVEAQVHRTPNATAVVAGSQRLTYEELNRRANVLAAALRSLGIGAEVLVGVCAERSTDLIVALLAVLKAGGAYVPIDPHYPRDRMSFMLADTKAPVLLTQRKLDGLLPPSDAKRIYLEEFPWDQAAPALSPGSQPANLAYVIYTSGSTGQPKGVAIEHRNAVNLVHWARTVFTPAELAGVLFSTSICFDLSVFELFATLNSGGKVIVAQNALELPTLPGQQEITLINTVPSAAAELVRLNAIPPNVQVINLAGEPLQTALVDRLYALGTLKKVYDLYGPSETTTYSTYSLRHPGAPPTIGQPIANTQVFLLDAAGQPVPIGVPGEIFIGGDGLARGYLQNGHCPRPAPCSERFIPNPFNPEQSARLYRTGDFARRQPDGNLVFIGRRDHQIKIRGFRVELGEIEATLGRHPAVRECAVVAREDTAGERRLVAYAAADRPAATPEALRSWLKGILPEYMIPSTVVVLDALPQTPGGKVDRRALPAPEQILEPATPSFLPPATAIEESLAHIWRELLHLPRVGVHDDFFALGGHSLLAVQLLVRVQEAFEIELPVSQLFETPTIAAFAPVLEACLRDDTEALSKNDTRCLVGHSL